MNPVGAVYQPRVISHVPAQDTLICVLSYLSNEDLQITSCVAREWQVCSLQSKQLEYKLIRDYIKELGCSLPAYKLVQTHLATLAGESLQRDSWKEDLLNLLKQIEVKDLWA